MVCLGVGYFNVGLVEVSFTRFDVFHSGRLVGSRCGWLYSAEMCSVCGGHFVVEFRVESVGVIVWVPVGGAVGHSDFFVRFDVSHGSDANVGGIRDVIELGVVPLAVEVLVDVSGEATGGVCSIDVCTAGIVYVFVVN